MQTQAWIYQTHDLAYRLEMISRPRGSLADNQIRVAVRAISLNYRDLIGLRNKAGRKVAGRVPASDGAGEVIEIGSKVTQWSIGDRVAGCFFPTWQSGAFDLQYHQYDLGGNLDGMLAQEAIGDDSVWVRLPDCLSFAEGATLPCAGVTAWQALVVRGALSAGQSVLTLGTGGVSTFAIQIASKMGAKVIVTSSSDEKLEKAKALGAWATINYVKNPDWDREVWRLTDAKGADHIIETGGPGTLERSLKSIAAGGQIAMIGVLTGFGPPATSLFPLLARNVSMHGIYVGSRQHFQDFNRFIEAKRLHPAIDRIFSFEQAASAFEYLESAKHFGKIVIDGIHG
jgi:NADPH:quinone reductase-like Zn-dependent oxidoreductase